VFIELYAVLLIKSNQIASFVAFAQLVSN